MSSPDQSLHPKITVVTVVRNAEETIETTLKSVLAQDYPNLEYIVVDGDSEDATPSIIQSYIDHIDRYVREPDQGIYDAMNKASELASGIWILYMNAGDRFYASDSLSLLTHALYSDADVISAGVVEVLVDCLETRAFRRMPRPVEKIWYQMPTSHQATLVRLAVQQQYRFDTRYQWCADHDMLARIYRDGKKFMNENSLLCIFDCSSSGTHRNPYRYIQERWQLSQGLAPLHQRLSRYGKEWVHCTIWGKVVGFIKLLLPNSTLLYLRRIRGTAGS